MAGDFASPALNKPIKTDVPQINDNLKALATMSLSDGANVPSGAKQLVTVTGGVQLQVFNGTSWVNVGKLIHDVDTLDSYHASTSATKNTVPVRDSNGDLPGNILGNAATATTATTLSETLPVNKGGTGATAAANARANLGVPPTSHASTATTYGAASDTNYGHVKLTDSSTDTTHTAKDGIAVSPSAVAGAIKNLSDNLTSSVKTDDATIKYDSTNDEIYASDIKTANGDLASARGQVGDIPTVTLSDTLNTDFNLDNATYWSKARRIVVDKLASFTGTSTNLPADLATASTASKFMLESITPNDGDTYLQRITVLTAGMQGREYTRNIVGASDVVQSKTDWVRSISQSEANAAYLPLTGGTVSGNLVVNKTVTVHADQIGSVIPAIKIENSLMPSNTQPDATTGTSLFFVNGTDVLGSLDLIKQKRSDTNGNDVQIRIGCNVGSGTWKFAGVWHNPGQYYAFYTDCDRIHFSNINADLWIA